MNEASSQVSQVALIDVSSSSFASFLPPRLQS